MDITLIVIIGVVVLLLLPVLQKTFSKSTVKPSRAKERIENEPGIIIDVRTPSEYNEEHLKRTDYNLNVMSNSFAQEIEKLDKDKSYYLYCRSGSRSGRAAKIMRRHGFENAYNIGGFQQLVRHGFEKNS